MTQPLGIDDFFSHEAGEYLERLGVLVSGATAPRPDELVRYARALRGSALMANQHLIARAASGMEHVLRAYRDGRRPWDMETATLVAAAVDELRDLVHHVTKWTPDDSGRAERLAMRLEAMAGPGSGGISGVSEAGVRAFLAREAATVASALDQAARSLRASSSGHEPMQAVLRRMQPLRGLAALSDFPPLAEILDGVERSSNALSGTAGSLLSELLAAAAQALARSARDVAEQGKPDPEATECREFAALLLKAEPPQTSVVPIETLFPDGEPGVVSRGTAPQVAPRVEMIAAELVSRGEHLCQAADELERATSPTMQSLRLHSLSGVLQILSHDVTDHALAEALDSISAATRNAIGDGSAASQHRQFAAILRQVGSKLRAVSESGGRTGLAETLAALAQDVRDIGLPAATPTPPSPVSPVAPPPVVSVAAKEDVVPIEALAPDDEAAPSAEDTGILASLLKYHRLVAENGLDGASLEELIKPTPRAAPAPAAAAVPAATPAPAATPVPASRPTAPVARAPEEPAVVDIAALCYRGRSALTRAAAVRLEIREAMESHAAGAVLRPLVEELLDLVDLAQVE
jgi:chemotaxis protein histidine kinase CheA